MTADVKRSKKHPGGAAEKLSFLACLELADSLDEQPDAILRTHGYVDEADLLERAYENGNWISKRERALLDALASLPEEIRVPLVKEIVAFAEKLPL